MRVNHEGILLSHSEEVVFSNNQINKVFETLNDPMTTSDKSKALIEILSSLSSDENGNLDEPKNEKISKGRKGKNPQPEGGDQESLWSQIKDNSIKK